MKRVLDARAVRRPIVVWLVVFAVVGGVAATRAAAQAGLLVPSSTDTQDPSVLSLREMKLDVGIARGYARVNVVQIFENHTDQVQEGTYRFALPPSAAVGDFAVWDGVVRIPGVILEKRRARAIYKDLTTQRIDPGLLQQGEEDEGEGEPEPGEGGGSRRPSGGALFSVTVAPIPPRATKRLEIQFQQELPFTEGAGELRVGLAPPDGEPLVAGHFEARVSGDASAVALVASPGGLPLTAAPGGPAAALAFSGEKVRLDRDLAVRLTPAAGPPLRLSAFRDVDGTLPDGVALAPWERRDEIPPEKDGFFLLEMLPPSDSKPSGGAAAKGVAASASRAPVDVAIAFDTSFSHRWAGLERGYAHLVRVLQSLGPKDRFALVPFDVDVHGAPAALVPASPAEIEKALAALRERPLGFGSDVAGGVRAAAALVKGSGSGRVLLISDGPAEVSASRLGEALAGAPLVSDLTGLEATEAYRVASVSYLVSGAADLETDLFLRRALEPIEAKPARRASATSDEQPFTTSGKPGLRDVYPVLVQPPAQGSLSGWVGRYANPASKVTFTVDSPVLPEKARTVTGDLPEQALDARDLPRRWARARVDYLLERIELEGERREWVEEIIALSKRYKFVTPYTAFLAAPRSLLRPRRIQPGDPVLRVECDEGTVAATALLPFGERLPLVRRPASNLWEGRFLVPEGLADGRYAIRIVLTDVSGARVTEAKHFVLDGTAPTISPQPPPAARAGERVRIAARADSDVVFLTARVGDGAPVPLRWDAAAKASVGEVTVPVTRDPRAPIFFEAVDGAKNRGFARASLEVLP